MATILVVDDDSVSRRAIAHVVRRLGHAVVVASDGPSALRLASETVPDLAIVDLRMPGMSGLDVIAGLRRIRPGPPKILVLTASGNSDDGELARAAGAVEYLTKPVVTARLADAIRAHSRSTAGA